MSTGKRLYSRVTAFGKILSKYRSMDKIIFERVNFVIKGPGESDLRFLKRIITTTKLLRDKEGR